MRVHDLYSDLFEVKAQPGSMAYQVTQGQLPPAFQHSMPDTHSFPDMDANYGFYRFVVAMAGHPETTATKDSPLRDQPIAIAYTEQEHEMIHKVAASMGLTPKELSYEKSRELPDTYTVSPVMKFHMPEGQQRRLRDAILLSEAMLDATD